MALLADGCGTKTSTHFRICLSKSLDSDGSVPSLSNRSVPTAKTTTQSELLTLKTLYITQ